jgi:hypothetical protein
MSYVHWQYQTGQGQIEPLTLEEFSKIGDLRPLLRVVSVEEKIHLLAVSTEVDGWECIDLRLCRENRARIGGPPLVFPV